MSMRRRTRPAEKRIWRSGLALQILTSRHGTPVRFPWRARITSACSERKTLVTVAERRAATGNVQAAESSPTTAGRHWNGSPTARATPCWPENGGLPRVKLEPRPGSERSPTSAMLRAGSWEGRSNHRETRTPAACFRVGTSAGATFCTATDTSISWESRSMPVSIGPWQRLMQMMDKNAEWISDRTNLVCLELSANCR